MPRFPKKTDEGNESGEEELGGQMSFLEHLDELRKRLIRSIAFVFASQEKQTKETNPARKNSAGRCRFWNIWTSCANA